MWEGRVPVGGTKEVTTPRTKAGCDLVSGLRVRTPCQGSVLGVRVGDPCQDSVSDPCWGSVSGLRVGGPCRGSVLEQLSCVGTGVTVASAFRARC